MKLTQVTKILELTPIPNSDFIERSLVLGWYCVVRKGLHKVGDTVIFVFPDTLIDKKLIDSTYEGNERIRLKTMKMRGQFSAGLVLPASVLGFEVLNDGLVLEEGMDVAEYLNIEKYETPMSSQLAGIALGDFPTFIVSKTDEDNYRSNPDAILELKEDRFQGQELVATTKCDGSSGTFFNWYGTIQGNHLRVCSRNLELKKDENNTFWKMAEKYKIEDTLKLDGRNLAIQSEICGEGIQGNKMNLKGQHMFIFGIKNLDGGNWFSWDDVLEFCMRSDYLQPVEELFRFKVEDMPSLEELQIIADSVKYDNGKTDGEGLVLKTVEPIRSNVLGKNWSVKFISSPYDAKK